MTKDEALKLALKALETNNKAWKHLADSGDAGFWEVEEQPFYELSVQAITAIKEALANEALEKKAENARELGLDYEPEHGWTPERIAGMARLKEAQDKKLSQPEQKPVAWMVWGENNVPSLTFTKPSDKYVFDSLYMTPPQRKEPEQEYHAVNAVHKGQQCYVKTQTEQDSGIVTAGGFDPRTQRTWVGLTEKDICEAAVKSQEGISPRDDTLRFAIAIEAKLKEKNT